MRLRMIAHSSAVACLCLAATGAALRRARRLRPMQLLMAMRASVRAVDVLQENRHNDSSIWPLPMGLSALEFLAGPSSEGQALEDTPV